MRWGFFILLLVLAGCGGASSGGGDIIPREPIVPIVPIADPAPTGTATYAGEIDLQFLAPSDSAAIDLDGNLTLTVDFDDMDAAVSGAATGFHQNGTPYTGNLLVNTGALDDSQGGLDFRTNINGSLLSGTVSFLVLGEMRGEVLGAGETAAIGNLSGQVLERGRTSPLSGRFQTARVP